MESALSVQATQEPTLKGKALETFRKAAGQRIRKHLAEAANLFVQVGDDLRAVLKTYSGDDLEAFWTWAVSVTNRSKGTCEQYINVSKVVEGMTAADRKRVGSWQIEPLQRLVATKAENRAAVVKESGVSPSVETVTAVRDRIQPKSAEDQAKSEERQRLNAADKTIALAKTIKPTVTRRLSKANVTLAGLIAGAELAQAYKGQDVAAALEQILSQTEIAAARAIKVAKVEKAALDGIAAIRPTA